MKQQAAELKVELFDGEVSKVARQEHCFMVRAGKATHEAKTIILAVGAEHRRLDLQNEQELTGKGVHYCITCDGPVYAGKTIAMVGGVFLIFLGVLLLTDNLIVWTSYFYQVFGFINYNRLLDYL